MLATAQDSGVQEVQKAIASAAAVELPSASLQGTAAFTSHFIPSHRMHGLCTVQFYTEFLMCVDARGISRGTMSVGRISASCPANVSLRCLYEVAYVAHAEHVMYCL